MSVSGGNAGGVQAITAADTTVKITGTDTAVQIAANIGDTPGTVAAGNDARFGEINGVQVTGTPTPGQIPVANSGTAASWQTPAGGGGGVTSVTAGDSTITVGGTATAPTVAAHVGAAAGTVAAGDDARFGKATAAGITDASAIGRQILTAPDAATVRGDIGAGTSDLALGTAAGTAMAGDTTPNQLGAPDNTGPVSILHLWSGTQAQYTALGTYDPNTLYVVNG